MTIYFDTSALVKKYNLEEGSENVINQWNQSEKVFTSVVTYA
jgi:predicted nucleic acid-binding protein